MEDSVYISATCGDAVIVSPSEGLISMGVHIRGGSVRVALTPEQAQELIEAISATMKKGESK